MIKKNLIVLAFLLSAISMSMPILSTIKLVHATASEIVLSQNTSTLGLQFSTLTWVHPTADPVDGSAIGQAFRSDYDAVLTHASFQFRKDGNPNGTLVARLYNVSAMFGVDMQPNVTDTPYLVQSNNESLASFNSTYLWHNFTFSTPYTILRNTHYAIALVLTATDGMSSPSNEIQVRLNQVFYSGNFISVFDGNAFWWVGSHWAPVYGSVYPIPPDLTDMPFAVYGNYDPAIVTPEIVIDANTVDSTHFQYLAHLHPTADPADGSAWGQAFYSPYKAYLTKASFILEKANLPNGSLTARLYDVTGTYGTDMKPNVTDTPYLTESDYKDTAMFSGKAWYNFTFCTPYFLDYDTCYEIVVVLRIGTFDVPNEFKAYRSFGNYHSGNGVWFLNGTWHSLTGAATPDNTDIPFYVYGDLIPISGAPISTTTFYIPPMYLFFGKVGDILACFGAIGIMMSRVRNIKDGLKGFVVSLLVFMVFLCVWYAITVLETFA